MKSSDASDYENNDENGDENYDDDEDEDYEERFNHNWRSVSCNSQETKQYYFLFPFSHNLYK